MNESPRSSVDESNKSNGIKGNTCKHFSVEFHGKRINHKHFVDFYVKDKAFIECKAAEDLCPDHQWLEKTLASFLRGGFRFLSKPQWAHSLVHPS